MTLDTKGMFGLTFKLILDMIVNTEQNVREESIKYFLFLIFYQSRIE